MLLRIIFPISIWDDMKIFLEEHAIVIVAESAVVVADDSQDVEINEEGNTVGHIKCSVMHKDEEGKKEKLMREKTMHLDIKADPELFRQVEEAVNTMAYGEIISEYANRNRAYREILIMLYVALSQCILTDEHLFN